MPSPGQSPRARWFVRWMREWLAPTLPRGTTVVLDNLSVHRNWDVRAAAEAAGCHLRYLPASSPDFTPIERAVAKRKTHLRSVGARTYAPLLAAIGAGLEQITPADITGSYQHCSFNLPKSPTQPS